MTFQSETSPNEVDSIFALLPASLKKSLEEQGISKPTPIQQAAYQPIMDGNDIIAQSRTGSGKTLAFGLPAFARLDKPRPGKPRLLVLTPTRELSQQVADVFVENFKPLGFKTIAIMGGSSYRTQISAISKGVDAIVATPGRLGDLLNQKVLSLTEVEILVLDEMDEMLDFGFAEDIIRIRDQIGKKAQTLLFSATFPPKVNRMARQMVSQPKEIKIASSDTTTGQIEHGFIEVKMGRNLDALLALLLYYAPDHAIVFCRTREETKNIHHVLMERGVPVGILNGEMSQQDRSQTMERFKNKQTRILVATDVAARGIDVSNLSHVIHFSIPANNEAYTHRAGRTGRAGADGKSWSLVAYNQRREYQFICQKLRLNPTRLELPNPKKIVQQFIKHKLFQMEIAETQGMPLIDESVEQFINTLDMDGMKSTLTRLLKSDIAHQIGTTLRAEDISPAFKTTFGPGAHVEQPAAAQGRPSSRYKGNSSAPPPRRDSWGASDRPAANRSSGGRPPQERREWSRGSFPTDRPSSDQGSRSTSYKRR